MATPQVSHIGFATMAKDLILKIDPNSDKNVIPMTIPWQPPAKPTITAVCLY